MAGTCSVFPLSKKSQGPRSSLITLQPSFFSKPGDFSNNTIFPSSRLTPCLTVTDGIVAVYGDLETTIRERCFASRSRVRGTYALSKAVKRGKTTFSHLLLSSTLPHRAALALVISKANSSPPVLLFTTTPLDLSNRSSGCPSLGPGTEAYGIWTTPWEGTSWSSYESGHNETITSIDSLNIRRFWNPDDYNHVCDIFRYELPSVPPNLNPSSNGMTLNCPVWVMT